MPQGAITQHLPAEAAAQAGSWIRYCSSKKYTRPAYLFLTQYLMTYRRSWAFLCAGAVMVCCFPGTGRAQDDTVQQLAAIIKSGPMLYRTPEAIEYYSQHGLSKAMAELQQQRDAAIQSLRAAIKLGNMGSRAREAVPVLIDMFPQLEHVVAKRSVHYTTGNGSLEDWVQTFLVSEKSNFVFSSPFVEFETISKCENWVEASPVTTMLSQKIGAGGRIVDAIADIFIILRVNAGACALGRITGREFGSNRDAWQRWWYHDVSGQYGVPLPAPGYPAAAGTRKKKCDDIVVGGKYKLHLVTGDDLAGTVTAKDDTSLVLKTESGSSYGFKAVLVDKYEMTAPPPPVTAPVASQKKDTSVARPPVGPAAATITFDDLAQGKYTGKLMEIHIKNGSVFRGTLGAVSGETVRINVEGSEIPISRNVITNMTIIPK